MHITVGEDVHSISGPTVGSVVVLLFLVKETYGAKMVGVCLVWLYQALEPLL